MAGAVYADDSDVADLWRTLSSDEQARANSLCQKASALLRQRLPNIDDRLALATTDPTNRAALTAEVVADVVASIVKRVMVNSDGVWSRTESVGPFSQSSTYVGRGSSGTAGTAVAGEVSALGELLVTAGDVAKLTPIDTPGLPASFQIQPPMMPACDESGPDDTDSRFSDYVETGVVYGPYWS